MSLLKINNPRSLLIKAETNQDSIGNQKKRVITIKSAKNEAQKVVINVVNPPEPKVLKIKQEAPVAIKAEPAVVKWDLDLQIPSELFHCHFQNDKDEVNEVPGEYYFETDHEVLRSNPDYQELIRTLSVLQAKKIQAIKDLEDLIKAREIAMKNPLKFLTHFKSEFTQLPGKQPIPETPSIDWDKYKIPSLSHVILKPETRNKGQSKKQSDEKVNEKVEGILDCKVERNAKGQYLVRGRVFDRSKPQTFNQPWTPEEQRRLEELLVEYPSEEIEMERWKKIATCLGNRTPVQVQSRVQKYFQKLQKAGMPVPGRYKSNKLAAGSGLARAKRPTNRGKYANSLLGSRNSTFFPDMKPDVKMTEEDEREADESVVSADSSDIFLLNYDDSSYRPSKYRILDSAKYYVVEDDVSDDEDIDPSKYNTPAYERLKWLKRIRREKELELRDGANLFVHTGYKCDGCGMEPIKGGRFTCSDCDNIEQDEFGEYCVDFCLDCAPKGLLLDTKPNHTSGHILKPVRRKVNDDLATFVDQDYIYETNNYLDPNYVK